MAQSIFNTYQVSFSIMTFLPSKLYISAIGVANGAPEPSNMSDNELKRTWPFVLTTIICELLILTMLLGSSTLKNTYVEQNCSTQYTATIKNEHFAVHKRNHSAMTYFLCYLYVLSTLGYNGLVLYADRQIPSPRCQTCPTIQL